MLYTAKDKLPLKEKGFKYYFLAGSIDYSLPNPWRNSLYAKASDDIHFFDPTRIDHDDLYDEEMRQQINWELDALEMSDKIILNFLPHAKSPISLVELGLYAKSGKLIVVCPDEFYQKRYVKTLCDRYGVPFFQDINQFNFKFA